MAQMNFEEQVALQDALERYAQGVPIAELASEMNLTEQAIRQRFQKYDFDQYKEKKGEAAQARIDLRHAENKRILSLNRQAVMDKIEDDELTISDRCRVEKTFGDRVAIVEGEATERQDHTGKVTQIVTFAEVQDDDTE